MICSCCGAEHSRSRQRYCCACHAAYMRSWRKTRPMTPEQRFKDKARSYANVYKKRGHLVPEPCFGCGSEEVEMHHHDYSKPLDVEWLCRPCHMELHKLEGIRPGEREAAA